MKYYFIIIMLSITPNLFAQHEVSGKVTDTDGIPLGGVNISVPGTSLGAVSDFDGLYSIRATSDRDSLTFSYIVSKHELWL